MQRLTKPVKPIGYLLALIIIIAALVIQLGRLTIPHLAQYRTAIAAFAGEQLQAEVSIGELAGSWYGLRPEIVLRDLVVVSSEQEPVLSIKHARMQLDILASLIHQVPVWAELELRGLQVTIRQNAAGGWFIGGLTTNNAQATGWRYQSPSALFLMARQVDIAAAEIHFILHNNRRLTPSIPHISIRNDGHFHRLTARTVIEQQPVMDFILEGVGNPANPEQFSATAYLKLRAFPLERIAALFAQVVPLQPPAADPQTGVDLQLWFDFVSPSRFFMNGQLGLKAHKQSSEFARGNFLDIPINTDIHGAYSIADGLTIGLRNLTVDQAITVAPLSVNLHRDQLTLLAETLDLALWSQWLTGRSAVGEQTGELLTGLSPRGRLDNIHLQVDLSAPEQTTLEGNIVDGAINPWEGIPGLQQVNAYIESDLNRGVMLLQTTDFHLHPQWLYPRPLSASVARGYLGWERLAEKNRLAIYGKQLMVAGAFGQASGYFDLLLPLQPDDQEAELTLQIGLKDSHADYYDQFLPTVFPRPLRQWMDQSIQSAVVNEAGFIFRGGLNQTSDSTIQFFTHLDKGVLNSEGWPAINAINASLVVNNNQMLAQVNNASFYEGDSLSGRVAWNPNGQHHLTIHAEGETRLTSGLRFIEDSWLGEQTGGAFDGWSGDGVIAVRSAVAIPMIQQQGSDGVDDDVQVELAITFNNNRLRLQQQRLDLTGINGEWSYSSTTGFNARNLKAQLFDETLDIEFGGGHAAQPDLWVKGRGAIAVDALSAWLGGAAETAVRQLLQGELDYDFNLTIPLQNTAKQPVALTLSSDLRGVELLLPAPFAKEPFTPGAFTLALAFEPETTYYRFRLDDRITGAITTAASGLPQGRVLLSDAEVSADHVLLKDKPTSTGLTLEGDFTALHLEPWLELLGGLSAVGPKASQTGPDSGGQPPLTLRINADEVTYGRIKLAEVALSARRKKSGWGATIASPVVAGEVFVPDLDRPVAVTLAHLHLHATDTGATGVTDGNRSADNDAGKERQDPMADVRLSMIKPLDITIQDLRYQDKTLGAWRFKVRPDATGIDLLGIKARLNDLMIEGRSKDQGAYLRWQFPSERNAMYTRFVGNLTGGNIQSLFDALQLPPVLQSDATAIAMEFEWAGSPANIGLEHLDGRIALQLTDGLFTQEKADNATGTLKLFGLLNFDTWARRIRLDFSDLYKKGLVYDRLSGRIGIDQGIITTREPMVLEGPSSNLSLKGSVDYPREEVRGELTATLPISGNLTAATALAAGLPAAVGVFIISKLFKKQVNQVSSIAYDISGSLDQPVIKVKPAGGRNPGDRKAGEGNVGEDSFDS